MRRTSTGLSEEQKATFRERAVPVPGAMLREGYTFTNDARRDIPSTIVATGYTSEDYQKYARENPDWAFLAGIPELRNVTWIDLPTSHWPMWSKPEDLARIIGEVAKGRPERVDDDASVDDAFAHHIWATDRVLETCATLTVSSSSRRSPARTARSSPRSLTSSGRMAGT